MNMYFLCNKKTYTKNFKEKLKGNNDLLKDFCSLGKKAMTNLDSILEKAMATHSIVLAWRIPAAGEPGGLTSMESHRVGHN